MSMGIGHNYWVQLIKHFCGSLEECIQFMNSNKPENETYWFELRPQVKIKKGKQITCNEYCCDLVTDAHGKEKRV